MRGKASVSVRMGVTVRVAARVWSFALLIEGKRESSERERACGERMVPIPLANNSPTSLGRAQSSCDGGHGIKCTAGDVYVLCLLSMHGFARADHNCTASTWRSTLGPIYNAWVFQAEDCGCEFRKECTSMLCVNHRRAGIHSRLSGRPHLDQQCPLVPYASKTPSTCIGLNTTRHLSFACLPGMT